MRIGYCHPKQRGWMWVQPHNIDLLRLIFVDAPQMRVGDQLPVYDRSHVARCIRYWRDVRKPGDVITIKLPKKYL